MRRSRVPQVGLDSQCLSYLLDGISGVSEPTDSLAAEKVALLRSWFYLAGTFTLTETVLTEVRKIRNSERRDLHESAVRTLFLDYPVRDDDATTSRAKLFQAKHPKQNDCRILAEAEELGLDILLTYDCKFWKRLRSSSAITRLMKPLDYWASLRIPRGAQPRTVPHHTNPLSQEMWWRW